MLIINWRKQQQEEKSTGLFIFNCFSLFSVRLAAGPSGRDYLLFIVIVSPPFVGFLSVVVVVVHVELIKCKRGEVPGMAAG